MYGVDELERSCYNYFLVLSLPPDRKLVSHVLQDPEQSEVSDYILARGPEILFHNDFSKLDED